MGSNLEGSVDPSFEVLGKRAFCYLLNKSVLNKLDLEELYCVVIGGQKTFLKIFKDHCERLR